MEKTRTSVSLPFQDAGVATLDAARIAPPSSEPLETLFQTANRLYADRQLDEAIQAYRRILELDPLMPEVHYNLGNAYLELRDFDRAAASFQSALNFSPEYAEAHFNLGIVYFEQGKLAQAIECYQRALASRPTMAEALYNLGLAHQEDGRLDDSIDCYRRLLKTRPGFAEAWNNLGHALLQKEEVEEALKCYHMAIQQNPGYADAHYNLGCLYHRQGRLNEAISSYRKAVELDPEHHKACNNLGKAFQDRIDVDRAVAWYQSAISIKPDYAEARFNLATAQLLRGDYAEGWQNYEWRFKKSDWRQIYPHRFDQSRWNGDCFAGKTLLVHCEQGFGDMLQFARYLPMVKACGGTLVLETRFAMLSLFERMEAVDRVVPFSMESAASLQFDCYIPLLSLPAIFRTALKTIPTTVPYLSADPVKAKHWEPRFQGDELRVGLVWAGTATDPRRATPLAWFAPLSGIEGLSIYGLQKGPAADLLEAEGVPKGMRMENIGRCFADFGDTAAAIDHLDLIVSIDTSVAHLAGAMAKPVYLLLPEVPDWRWMLDRDDSPWYPTLRLFRQQTAGDWGPPLTRIARRLDSLARNLLRARSLPGTSGLTAVAAQLHQQGNLMEASIFYHRLLRQAPNHPEGFHGLGLIALQTGNPGRAVDLIKKGLAASPDSDRYYYNLGLAFLALGCREQATDAFQKARDLNPRNADAEFNLNRLHRPGF